MKITAQAMTRTLATLIIATGTLIGALYVSTGVAYASHVDRGHGLRHHQFGCQTYLPRARGASAHDRYSL
jgi:hypothetical protein